MLGERLVDENCRLKDVILPEHRVAVAGLRPLVGAPDTAAFRLSGSLATRTGLGQRPAATQLSFDAAVAASAD